MPDLCRLPATRRKAEVRDGRVGLRGFGTWSAARSSAAKRSTASSRF